MDNEGAAVCPHCGKEMAEWVSNISNDNVPTVVDMIGYGCRDCKITFIDISKSTFDGFVYLGGVTFLGVFVDMMVPLTWEGKAEWLRSNGYGLTIEALGNLGTDDDSDGDKWMACIAGEGRRYALTIGAAVEQVFEWVTAEEFQAYRKREVANVNRPDAYILRDYHADN